MAHKYDDTLLAKLGFQDPDRNLAEHDAACRYFGTSNVLDRLEEKYRPNQQLTQPYAYNKHYREVVRLLGQGDVDQVQYERLLTKGKGDYRTIIGFLDVVIPLGYLTEIELVDKDTGKPVGRQTRREMLYRPLVVEVKIMRVEIGHILRQIHTYREFINDYAEVGDSHLYDLANCRFIVATKFPLTRSEVEMLRGDGIDYVQLGGGFTKYLAEEQQHNDNSAQPSMMIL